jgi:hypothetical protein
MDVNPVGEAIKAVRRAVSLQQAWRQSSKAGRGTGIAPPLHPGGTFPLHHNPPLGWIVTAHLSRKRKRQFPLAFKASSY